MVSPAKLAHVALLTNDLEASSRWYRNVLDAEVVFDNGALCFMTYDDEHHRVVLAEDPNFQPGGPSAGLHHVSFTYARLDDLFDSYERLQALDIRPHWCINHGPTLSLYYRDPMHNQVELQVDTMTLDETQDFLRSEVFRANPIGIEFDPEELNRRRKAGESFRALTEYGA